ncbi:MAG: hypothetical protein EOO27_13995 [Comamonadaceae bacterium]|nr:MAG: hypothetical protein EOO27_13995 [Comamonadaceae bacterium]
MKNARTRTAILTVIGIALLILHVAAIITGIFYIGSMVLGFLWIAGWVTFDLALIFNPWRKKVNA